MRLTLILTALTMVQTCAQPTPPMPPGSLHWAAFTGDVKMANGLLGKRPWLVRKRLPGGLLPLHHAAMNNWTLAVARLLVNYGADINGRTNQGYTPLHYAAFHGSTEVAEYLVKKGARVDLRNSSGQTPLHEIFRRSEPRITGLLVTAGADVNVRDNNARTPLYNATHFSNTVFPNLVRIAEILREHGGIE